jgi:molybdopterin-binding protein
MNRWPGSIRHVDRDQGLARITCGHDAGPLHALVVDDGAGWIRAGRAVHLLFKETEVVLSPRGTAPWPGSFPAKVASVRRGRILSEVELECAGSTLCALLDSAVEEALGIREGLEVDAWIPPAALALEDGET